VDLVGEEHPDTTDIRDDPARQVRREQRNQWYRQRRSSRDRVRPTAQLADAIVTIGDYAVGEQAEAKNRTRLAVTARLAERAQRVRMLGSAAIDLAWLAQGRTDAAIMFSNKPWDTAAGVILVREAGGRVVDADGAHHTMQSASTIAAPDELLDQVLELIAAAV
jgi:myo-inositol-1(or 4)-monophosphatase